MSRKLTFILFCSIVFPGLQQVKSQSTGDSTNLALTATVSTSYVSSWETLAAVNDGYEPSGSGDKAHGAYGNWTGAVRALLDGQFITAIKAEWEPSWMSPATWYATPYAKTTNNGSGLLTPEARTTPGWSGANQIPLKVTGDVVTVNFQPLSPNMSCQLCYRTTTGQTVYSNPVYGGDCSLKLDQAPANNVVFAVICNTDYIYLGEETRKAHFNYKLQLATGVTGAADINTRWYQWDRNLGSSTGQFNPAPGPEVNFYPNPVTSGNDLKVTFGTPLSESVWFEIWSLDGSMLLNKKLSGDSSINLHERLSSGVYFAVVRSFDGKKIQKIIVN